MRLLFLTPQLPYPPHKGTAMRNYYLIANLAARHEIDLLTFVEAEAQLRQHTPLSTLCRRIEGVVAPRPSLVRRAAAMLLSPWPDMGLRLWSPGLAARFKAWLADTPYDLVQIEGIELARYIEIGRRPAEGEHQPSAAGHPKFVFDDHNCEYVLQQRTFETDLRQPRRWIGAAYSFVQWRKLRAFEAAVCRSASHVLAVSEADAAALKRLVPGLEPAIVPNGIDMATVSRYCLTS